MSQGNEEQVLETPGLEGDETVTADQVTDYLVENPDFFEDNSEVLSMLSIPGRFGTGNGNGGTGVVDFQQVLLDQQKEALKELRECVQDVIETSRTNMSVQQRTHAAALALLSARDFDGLIRVIADDLALLLDVDVVIVGYEPTDSPLTWLVSPELENLSGGLVDALLGAGQDAKLFRELNDDGTVFGSASPLVQSAAIARLRPGRGTPQGLMALGSRGSDFQPGQGTELVVFLARVLENCVDRLQEPLLRGAAAG